MSGRLILAVPSKGRLKEQVEAWLADCGAPLKAVGGDRGYSARLDGLDEIEVRLLSAGDVLQDMVQGSAGGEQPAPAPETVARLARSQERELRAWLYTDRPAPGTSVADAFTDLAGEIEDRYGVAVDAVCVGDRAPDRDTEVIVAAAREALSNAVRHGAPPVSLDPGAQSPQAPQPAQ